MKKYRIVEKTKVNGEKLYVIQRRYTGFPWFLDPRFFWKDRIDFETFERAKSEYDEILGNQVVSIRNMWEVSKS